MSDLAPALNFDNAAQAGRLAVSWVQRNGSVASDLLEFESELTTKLARTINRLDFSATNLSHRPTIGLFGASQAGKSYLVSSLASGGSQQLTTTWDGVAIDFIRHINPSGNNSEATGFATRFSHEKQEQIAGFPVQVQVLSEIELAMILINAFFQDINQREVKAPNDEDFYLRHLNALESLVDRQAQAQDHAYPSDLLPKVQVAGDTTTLDFHKLPFTERVGSGREVQVNGQREFNYISDEQVVELADYIAANSNGKLGTVESMPRFWTSLRKMLPYMNLEGRVKALSVFWQGLPIFNETYRVLAAELLKLKGHLKVFLPLSAFVEQKGDGYMQNESGTIMHITKLNTMFSDSSTIACAMIGESERPQLSVSKVAALACELNFVLEQSGQLDEFDVLDLPGARSRDVVRLQDVVDDGANYSGGPLNEQMQLRGSEFFRRGKVAFLFDRYARRQEIEQLLFCIGVNAQQDVTSVLTILTDWVEKNVGATPSQRENSANPLTIVLTRYDEVINRQLKNITTGIPVDMKQEVNIALNRIQKLNWFNEWTPGKPFDHILLARKPNLGELNPWLDCDANNVELGIKPERQENIQAILDKLLEVPDFNAHIANFRDALDAVLKLNDGGVSKIVANVLSHCLKPQQRVSLRTYKALNLLSDVQVALAPFAKRDSAVAMEKAKRESSEIALGLMQCNALAPCFDLLRNLLEIDESRLEEIYQQGFAAGSNVQRFVKDVCTEYLGNVAELSRKDNNKINAIADLVCHVYGQIRPNLEADPDVAVYFPICFVPEEHRLKTDEELKDDIVTIFNRFYSEVAKTFMSPQVGLRDYMVRVLLVQENVNEGFGDIVRVQVSLMHFILSDFNLYLGANLLNENGSSSESKAAAAPQLTPVQAPKPAPAPTPSQIPTPKPAPQPSAAAAPQEAGGYGDDDFSDLGDLDGFDDENSYGDNDYTPVASVSNVVPVAPAPSAPDTIRHSVRNDGNTDLAKVWGQTGVIGSKTGPINSFSHQQNRVYLDSNKQSCDIFSAPCSVDDTGLLPRLNAQSADYEFKLISDFSSVFMYMMTRVNVLSENKYQFAANENLLLCQILATLEKCQ